MAIDARYDLIRLRAQEARRRAAEVRERSRLLRSSIAAARVGTEAAEPAGRHPDEALALAATPVR